MNTIEHNKKYKGKKKKEIEKKKSASNYQKKLKQRHKSIERQIVKQREKKFIILSKPISKKAKKKTKKKIKKTFSFKKIKDLAFKEFQLYCKLFRSWSKNWKIYVLAYDIWVVCSISRVQWWHVYSKHNYPHIAFDVDNCRPILPSTNRSQFDKYWEWFCKVPLSSEAKQKLKEKAENWIRETLYTKKYYELKYEYYKELNRNEYARLWFEIDKKSKKKTCN